MSSQLNEQAKNLLAELWNVDQEIEALTVQISQARYKRQQIDDELISVGFWAEDAYSFITRIQEDDSFFLVEVNGEPPKGQKNVFISRARYLGEIVKDIEADLSK